MKKANTYITSLTAIKIAAWVLCGLLVDFNPCAAQQSGPPGTARIAAFWRATRAQLDTTPLQAEVTKIAEALPYSKYKIVLSSLGNVRVIAFMGIPVQGESKPGPWPVIITTCGYSGTQQGIMLSECQRGYAVIQLYPRGQGESASYFQLPADKVAGSAQKPEGAYYQGAYADVMRVIDFIATRPDLDANRVALVATSQGGGISLAVAGLDSRVKAVVAHVSFLCNMPMAAGTPSLIKNRLDKFNLNNSDALNVLAYFDCLQLAPMRKFPVLMSAGGKDTTCPLPTIQSVYERLRGKKSLKIYPDLTHTSCLDFYNQTWKWLEKNFKNKHD